MSLPMIQEKVENAARCSKCGSTQIRDDSTRSSGERVCLICGRREYFDLPTPARKGSWVERVRYNGPHANLRGIVIDVRIQSAAIGRLRVQQAPSCPWCGEEMTEASLTGLRRVKDERRFACRLQHRISLLPLRGGRTVWR